MGQNDELKQKIDNRNKDQLKKDNEWASLNKELVNKIVKPMGS